LDPLKIVLHGALVYDLVDVLRLRLAAPATVARLLGTEPAREQEQVLRDADVAIAMTTHGLALPPGLRLLQVPGAGLDLVQLDLVPPGAFVCNAYGHDIAGGEYVVMALLAWCHQLVPAHETFKAGSWRMSGRCGAPLHEELHGKTVGILGLGSIGLAAARLVKPFGATVLAANRSLGERPPFVDELHPLSDLPSLLPRCDFVVVCLAQTPETVGLIGRAAFRSMRRDAVLVNVARGPIVDERAFFEALRDGTIGGAVIDAWYRYPQGGDLRTPPSELPFHELPNVVMTPHTAIWTRGMIERRWAAIAHNVDAIASGSTGELRNVVRRPLAAG